MRHHYAIDAGGAGSPTRHTLVLALVIVAVLAFVVHPLRALKVEPERQALLGLTEPPGRRLALASQFGFLTAAGAGLRIVPGRPSLDLGDVPGEAATLILGGFRGPYVVWLWMKAEAQKQQRTHEGLVDRYARIAALQPDYPAIWTHLAWNMAWNVPAQRQSLEHKYAWARSAIDFLAEGYRKNPRNAQIMAEMGRIYSERLGKSQEASFYRRRVREDEGRSVFLIAYEWYDRARKASDRYHTLGSHGLAKPVVFSQACHNVSYYAKELSQLAYDDFKAGVDARAAADETKSREAYARAMARLQEAVAAWQWAAREWQEHAVRFEAESRGTDFPSIYRRFYEEARDAAVELTALRADLTYENLPERFSKMTRPVIE
jgi:hypothetical protein